MLLGLGIGLAVRRGRLISEAHPPCGFLLAGCARGRAADLRKRCRMNARAVGAPPARTTLAAATAAAAGIVGKGRCQ
jgi:hypothetical protein